jgi:hypothetical protein
MLPDRDAWQDVPEETLRYGEPAAPAEQELPAAAGEDLWLSLKALWTGGAEAGPPPAENDPVWPFG